MEYDQIFTICYLFNEKGEVLLQKKARGFGQGKWNGPGGKKEKGETPEESMLREIWEETGVRLNSWEMRGELEFIFNATKQHFFSYVYISCNWSGEPKDRGEGEIKWFKPTEIPLPKMWDDDQYWLLDLLSGKQIKMRFYFDKDNKITDYKILK